MPYPTIVMPFASHPSPAVERAERHAREWLVSQSLLDPDDPDLLTLPRLGRLAAFAYPAAEPAALDMAADWVTWLYVFDDRYADEGSPDPALLAGQVAHLLDALDGAPPAGPLAAALADLVGRHRDLATAEQTDRFVANVRGYLLGVLAEVSYRSAGRVPTLAEYLPLRLQASGCLPCLSLVEICAPGRPAAGSAVHEPCIAALTRLAGSVIALANDIYSCPREIDQSPVPFIFNLPLVLAENEHLPLSEAMRRAVVMTQDLADRLARDYRTALAEGDYVAAYCRGLADWTQGTFEWMARSGRYAAYWESVDEGLVSTGGSSRA
jgi:hypothetical protein